jgi:hypothetical protein
MTNTQIDVWLNMVEANLLPVSPPTLGDIEALESHFESQLKKPVRVVKLLALCFVISVIVMFACLAIGDPSRITRVIIAVLPMASLGGIVCVVIHTALSKDSKLLVAHKRGCLHFTSKSDMVNSPEFLSSLKGNKVLSTYLCNVRSSGRNLTALEFDCIANMSKVAKTEESERKADLLLEELVSESICNSNGSGIEREVTALAV